MLKVHPTVQVEFLCVEKWLLFTWCRTLAARHPANTVTKIAVKLRKNRISERGLTDIKCSTQR